MTDPIADMLVRIKNALDKRAETVDIPHSGTKEGLARILREEGYIAKYDILKRMNKSFIRLAVKYRENKQGVITNLKRVSRPGKRIYADVSSLPRVQGGFGTAIISTSRGLMTDEKARQKNLGGEVLCLVW